MSPIEHSPHDDDNESTPPDEKGADQNPTNPQNPTHGHPDFPHLEDDIRALIMFTNN